MDSYKLNNKFLPGVDVVEAIEENEGGGPVNSVDLTVTTERGRRRMRKRRY